MDITLHHLIYFAISLLVTYFVWRYYRDRTFLPGEKYSTFNPRFWRLQIDACILAPVGLAVALLLTLQLPPSIRGGLAYPEDLALLFYTVILFLKYGQTYGMKVCKLKVVDFRTEGPISFRQACLRQGIPIGIGIACLVYAGDSAAAFESGIFDNRWLIAMIPALWGFADLITLLSSRKNRALHDLIAGTVVVRTHLVSTPTQHPNFGDRTLVDCDPSAVRPLHPPHSAKS